MTGTFDLEAAVCMRAPRIRELRARRPITAGVAGHEVNEYNRKMGEEVADTWMTRPGPLMVRDKLVLSVKRRMTGRRNRNTKKTKKEIVTETIYETIRSLTSIGRDCFHF
uniref:(California timema) hypothetical protein n=1 Tax=Timema californicum TaxID=61474 RepID=A0A7R9JJ44_TIMCA|nr:unnamed protein product [Timema californicum]